MKIWPKNLRNYGTWIEKLVNNGMLFELGKQQFQEWDDELGNPSETLVYLYCTYTLAIHHN